MIKSQRRLKTFRESLYELPRGIKEHRCFFIKKEKLQLQAMQLVLHD